MPVTIGALRESAPQETRVSLVPEVADKFAQSGARVLLERGAGSARAVPGFALQERDLGRLRRQRCWRSPTWC